MGQEHGNFHVMGGLYEAETKFPNRGLIQGGIQGLLQGLLRGYCRSLDYGLYRSYLRSH